MMTAVPNHQPEPIYSPDGKHVWNGSAWEMRDASPAEADADFKHYVNGSVVSGYRVVSQTSSSAQLVKPKQFNAVLFIILFLLCIIPAVIYVAIYAAEKDQTLYVEMRADGLFVNGHPMTRVGDRVVPLSTVDPLLSGSAAPGPPPAPPPPPRG